MALTLSSQFARAKSVTQHQRAFYIYDIVYIKFFSTSYWTNEAFGKQEASLCVFHFNIMIVLSAYIAVLNAGVLIIMMSDYQNQVSKICNSE